MVKIEHSIINERGIVAFSIESNNAEGLKTLDLLNEALSGGYPSEIGFSASNQLVLHVRGMPESTFTKT